MEYTIENEQLKVVVSDIGAELQSIFHKQGRGEQLWQGDAAIWRGRSPLLFPVVGKLKEDSYRYQGERFAMPKHGFARFARFEPVRHDSGLLELALGDSEVTGECYPFPFTLSITYSLRLAEVSITYRVTNKGDGTMYYSLGAHPGFGCLAGDRLNFDGETTIHPRRLGKDMLLGEPSKLELDQGTLSITKELFDHDALIMTDIGFNSVSLRRRGDNSCVRVSLGGAPCLGIWAKPGAPYVCIEPWFGADDTPQATGDIEEKPYIQALAAQSANSHTIGILIQ